MKDDFDLEQDAWEQRFDLVPEQDLVEEESDEESEARRKLCEFFDWMDSIVYSVALVVLLLTFVFRMITVDGRSMTNTLQDRDRVFLVSAFYQPRPGDIVVFTKLPRPLIKRVIALGGQTVDIDYGAGTVTVDGVMRQEPYIREPMRPAGDVAFPLTVPPGQVFVMGDNRNNSSDSRVSSVGCVDTRYIVGRVLFRVAPFGRFGKIPDGTQ